MSSAIEIQRKPQYFECRFGWLFALYNIDMKCEPRTFEFRIGLAIVFLKKKPMKN